MSLIHLIGYGAQGKAIAPSLSEAGFEVNVYLREGSASLGEPNTLPLSSLTSNLNDHDLIIFTCPDRVIGEVYKTYLISSEKKLHHVLLHGFAVWSKDIEVNEQGNGILNPKHSFSLCAPKAIGPELREAIINARASGTHHSLKAAFFSKNQVARALVLEMATQGLNFALPSLIPATFEQETVGDLISEQLLLCGGVFSLLEWTIQEMRNAGVPEALIQEECFTELGLIARVLEKRGLEGTVNAIRDSAKAGAVMMRERFIEHGLPEILHTQAQEVLDGTFLKKLKGESESVSPEAPL